MPYKDPTSEAARESKRRATRKYTKKHPDRAKKARLHWKAKRRHKARQMVIEAKNKPCMDCGESYPHYIMDLDHRDPDEKVMSVASMVGSQRSLSELADEIEKCDVVCSNCHRERTFQQYAEREGSFWYDKFQ